MTTTRLGLIGVGVDAYAAFQAKVVGHNPGVITRLVAFAVGGAKYGVFLPKAAAQPQPEEPEFFGFPAISFSVIEGDGYGILPNLWGTGRGIHGVAGRVRWRLRKLRGRGNGRVDQEERGRVRLVTIGGTATAVQGQQGSAVAYLKGPAGISAGGVGVQGAGDGSVVIGIKGAAIGEQDDDIAMIAFLLAA